MNTLQLFILGAMSTAIYWLIVSTTCDIIFTSYFKNKRKYPQNTITEVNIISKSEVESLGKEGDR